MNQEPVDVRKAQEQATAKQQLEDAIKHYLAVIDRPDENALPNGVLTAWYLITEEHDPISGEGARIRAVRDLQSSSTTMGLIVYSDEFYRNRMRNN